MTHARQTFRQQGAALLLAMLTVALVATLSTASLWQQWRALSIETAERQRLQASWVLIGALDWARLILHEDARSARPDHLAEPWAVPLQEARLSSFLAADRNSSADLTLDAFLSGEIQDMQGRLNLRNLVTQQGNRTLPSEPDVLAFGRLFDGLGLPRAELDQLVDSMQQALNPADARDAPVPLLPRRWGQLGWLGLSQPTLMALAPHATWLPERTPLNLNTASPQALQAAIEGLDRAQAARLVEARASRHFRDLGDVVRVLPSIKSAIETNAGVAVSSRYFEVRGTLRLDDVVVEETSLVVRNVYRHTTVWRERRARQMPPSLQ